MKYYVISDIHSTYDEMQDALAKAGFNKDDSNTKLIMLGDAFDKGNKPVEVWNFLLELLNNNKLVWIKGNHDDEFISVIKNKKYTRDCKETALKIAEYYYGKKIDENNIELVCDILEKNKVLDVLENKTVDYFETNNYVFTHGFIPTNKGNYNPDWRTVEPSKWKALMVRKANGIKMVEINGIRVPNKTIVTGHVGCYYGNFLKEYSQLEFGSNEFEKERKKYAKNANNYKPYYGNGIICIDANGYKNGFINVIKIED